MRKFQIWWIKVGCFLTGYDFYVLSNCSEVAIRKVKKYTAALIIISIIWAFVGFTFGNRYVKLDLFGSIIGALVACLIVIQIERQILMGLKSNKMLIWSRVIIAVLMAVIGSLVIDQLIFKEDIEKAKIASNQEQVNLLMPTKAEELNRQIGKLDSIIQVKESDRKILTDDISLHPTIVIKESSIKRELPTTTTSKDSLKEKTRTTQEKLTTILNNRAIENPKINQLKPLDTQIETFREQLITKENNLLELQSILEKDVKSKTGFLDELQIMFKILRSSTIAIIVYSIWFLLLLFLELLILFSKVGDKDSDYELVIAQQMEMHQRKILLLNDPNKTNSSN